MPTGEFAARARLQIALESGSLGLIVKRDSSFNGPRFEFRGVRNLARVVCGEAGRQIGCHSDVMALGRSIASEDINIVKHA